MEIIMKKINLLFIGIFIALISGCATASFTQTGQTFSEYKGVVKVFSEPPENIEYIEVGIVSSKGGTVHNATDLIKALQKKAAKNGANAIILAANKETQGFVASEYYTGSTTAKEMTAIAIRIKN
jgi:hypothetical protein